MLCSLQYLHTQILCIVCQIYPYFRTVDAVINCILRNLFLNGLWHGVDIKLVFVYRFGILGLWEIQ